MPHAKKEKQIEKKERVKVIIHDEVSDENYYFLLTEDQIRFLYELNFCGLMGECTYQTVNDENWVVV